MGGGGGESFTDSFSSNLNNVNLKISPTTVDIQLKMKPQPFYIIMIKSEEVSKAMSCSVSLMLTLTWGIDTLFQKLAPHIGGWIWKTPFAHYAPGVEDPNLDKKYVQLSDLAHFHEILIQIYFDVKLLIKFGILCWEIISALFC